MMMDEDNVRETERRFRRLTATVRLFIPKLTVLETMIPSDFIHFRDNLKPASGFQSRQFLEVEFICGVRSRRYLTMFDDHPTARKRLEERLEEPSL
jgi:tryptophan 2,3-dioxygenase